MNSANAVLVVLRGSAGAARSTGATIRRRVSVVRSPEADCSRYASFSFHVPLGTDRTEGTATILSQTLKQTARLQQ